MNNLTELILVVIYALLAGAFFTALFTAMAFNMRAGEMYREKLAKNLELIRMNGMLKAVGIDTSAYLHKQSVNDIKTQMATCAACDQTDSCDSQLEQGTLDPDNIDYCPNDAAMRKIKENKAEV